jgi:hypothetical protein
MRSGSMSEHARIEKVERPFSGHAREHFPANPKAVHVRKMRPDESMEPLDDRVGSERIVVSSQGNVKGPGKSPAVPMPRADPAPAAAPAE